MACSSMKKRSVRGVLGHGELPVLVGDLAVEEDPGFCGVGGVEGGGALDEQVVALEDVGGFGDVGRDDVSVLAVGVDDEGEADWRAPVIQSAREIQNGAPAEALAEEDDLRLRGFFARE